MIYSTEIENMCQVRKGANHGPAPIPEEGRWVKSKEITAFSVGAAGGYFLSFLPLNAL